jgi:Fibronectin type III domain
VNLLVVLAIISTVVALAVTRGGVPASAMRLLTGDAWLENASAGTVSHVNGYSGETDAQAPVGKAGDPFQVVQRQGGAFVLDLRTGRLSRLDDSGLNVTTSATEPTPAKALQVITGTNATWILDKSSGVLQQVNPTTLKPLGHQVALGGRTGTGVIDSSGSIWVPLLSGAGVDQVNPGGALSHHAFGRAGDAIELADTSGGVWAVDAHAKTVASLSTPTDHTVSLPALTKAPIVGASASSPDLVLVSGDQVLNVNTTQQSLSSLALPAAAASVTQVAVSSGSSGSSSQAYLLDPQTHRLDTLNLSPMGIEASTPVPTGANQLVDKDQLVFVNSTSAPQALVVNPEGTVTNVTKYNLRVPPQSNGQGQGSAPSNSAPGTTPTTTPQTTPPGSAPAGMGPPTSDQQQPTASGNPASTAGLGPTAPPTTAAPSTIPAPTARTPRTPPTTVPPSTTAPIVPPTTEPPSTTTSAPPGPPGAPTINSVTPGNGQVTVSWSPPASDGGSPVIRYQVTGSPVNASASVTVTTATLTNLPNGTRECVQVQAVNAAAGGGPLSPANQFCATPEPPATPPGEVGGLSVNGGDKQVIVSWTAAGVAPGSPPVTGYQVTVGGGAPQTTTATSLTVPATPWATENVSVRAANSVGLGPAKTGSYVAWTRTGTVTCEDSLSGDHAVENDCTLLGGAWTQHPDSVAIDWIDPVGHIPSGDGFEWLCSTYYVLTVGKLSADVYAVETNAPTQAACTTALPGFQAPDTPHVIAAVSSSPQPGSQHICIYQGTTSGTDGNFISRELSPYGTVPAGLSGASQVSCFYT